MNKENFPANDLYKICDFPNLKLVVKSHIKKINEHIIIATKENRNNIIYTLPKDESGGALNKYDFQLLMAFYIVESLEKRGFAVKMYKNFLLIQWKPAIADVDRNKYREYLEGKKI